MSRDLTVDELERSWQTANHRLGCPIIMPSEKYSDTFKRVRSGEDVRLPISGLQFAIDSKGVLYLKWPVST